MTASAFNKAFSPSGAYGALLALAREVKIEVALTAPGVPPSSGDWFEVFRGRIDSIDPASGDQVKLSCRDLGGYLADLFLEDEYVLAYGSVSGSPVAMIVWQPNRTFSVGDYILPTDANRNGRFYKCTTGGVSGTTEPAWTTSGVQPTDGTAVHTFQATTTTAGFSVESVMQSLLDKALSNAGATAVTLYVPTSPSWVITQYKQDRTGLLEALRTLGLQIGWEVRYRWRAATSQFELTLYAPNRSASSADYTFAASTYADVTSFKTDVSDIRNAVRVIYSDATDLDPSGNAKRKTCDIRTDATSIASYGRRFMEIAEASTSQIDSLAEAQRMADAALADLATPIAEQTVELVHGFPFVELGDYYQFSANGRHYDADQKLAVYSFSHTAQDGYIQSSFVCRGKPSLEPRRWLEVETHPGNSNSDAQPAQLQTFETTAALTIAAASTVGGALVSVTSTPPNKARGLEHEYHLDTSGASFTPSSGTLKGSLKGGAFEVSSLIPGKTYYAKVVPITRDEQSRILRGQPSAAVPFVAGRANVGHLASEVNPAFLPLNGTFEHASGDLTTTPLDHWTPDTGVTWGASGDVYYTTDAAEGRCLRVRATASTGRMLSSIFPVIGGTKFELSIDAKGVTYSGFDTYQSRHLLVQGHRPHGSQHRVGDSGHHHHPDGLLVEHDRVRHPGRDACAHGRQLRAHRSREEQRDRQHRRRRGSSPVHAMGQLAGGALDAHLPEHLRPVQQRREPGALLPGLGGSGSSPGPRDSGRIFGGRHGRDCAHVPARHRLLADDVDDQDFPVRALHRRR
jgi:hypothetical protein